METDIWVILAVDGILNNSDTKTRSPDGYTGIDETNLQTLAGFVRDTGAKVILRDAWAWEIPQNTKADMEYLQDRLDTYGIKIADFIRKRGEPGAAIREWLEVHPGLPIIFDEGYLIFDLYPDLHGNVFCVQPETGLTVEDVMKARSFLQERMRLGEDL